MIFKTPQYKINVYIGEILNELGLPNQAEPEIFIDVDGGKKRIPDFIIEHPLAGGILGEAEFGETEYDLEAMSRLEKRVNERFSDPIFKGYDFALLFIYPKRFSKLGSKAYDNTFRNILMNEEIGLGIGVRNELMNTSKHFIKWYLQPTKIINLPTIIDQLINDFFRELKRRNPSIKIDVLEFIGGIESLIDETTSRLASRIRKDDPSIEVFSKIAYKLDIAWDNIKNLEDRITILVKFILLISTLLMIFYEILRNEKEYRLEPLNCRELTTFKLSSLLQDIVEKRDDKGYLELNHDFVEVLRVFPADVKIHEVLTKICEEIRGSYVILRRMGWDILSMFYQRLLSKTYRHAFATFYTKMPAARMLASLSINGFRDKVIDPACGTGSLLLASVERRKILIKSEELKELYKRSIIEEKPLLDVINHDILANTVGLDALKPACFITALNLRISTRGSPPNRLNIITMPVGVDEAGSLDLLIHDKASIINKKYKLFDPGSYDVVLMNPPFTRIDRISYLIGKKARDKLISESLSFGGVKVSNLFISGMAKPFLILADKLLKEGGRLGAVLPTSILSRYSWIDVRKGLLNKYKLKYIVISWAHGTPNFSSDTNLREILLVAEKSKQYEKDDTNKCKIINLYKKIDDLSIDEIESITKKALAENKELTIFYKGQIIGSINVVNISDFSKDILIENMYRLVAFKNKELSKLHINLITQCSKTLSELFKIGSAITQTSGLGIAPRNAKTNNLLYVKPAIWGSGENLGIKKPHIKDSPHIVYVRDYSKLKIRYWDTYNKQVFYVSTLFLPRRMRISTQYVLMILSEEPSVSNVWYPVKPYSEDYVFPYLLYMNSTFGFINLLGERAETEGLYIEFKKHHLSNIRIPDLSKVSITSKDKALLSSEMPRFDHYIDFMATKNINKTWREAAIEVINEASHNQSLKIYANRALIDLKAYDLLVEACHDINIPDNMYVLLRDEINTLAKIMEHRENIEEVEDIPSLPEKKIKHVPLNKWFDTS